MLTEMNERSEAILRYIVDAYMDTGEPVGSRTISKKLGMDLSPATIRNVMADLENEGLLFAPHTSAGRLPTQQGLRLYVDGLMEIGDLTKADRNQVRRRRTLDGVAVRPGDHHALGPVFGRRACDGT